MIRAVSSSSAGSSLLAAAASSAARRTAAQQAARRSMVTKAERWDASTPAAAQSLLSGSGSLNLKEVVPQLEARWKDMVKEEQYAVFRQLEELQKKDWKELTLDEKKAAYFISFGPHGPRKPVTTPGQSVRTLTGIVGLLGATVGLWYGLRHFFANKDQPKTMTREYQEAMTERAREENQNPITGIASEGYKGKGHAGNLH